MGVPLGVKGDMTVTFAQLDAAHLFIESGSWNGTIGLPNMNPPQPFIARLNGTLDCASGRLEADVVNGSFTLLVKGTFTGTLSGTFEPLSQSFSATEWSIEEPNADPMSNTGKGSGTWTLTRQGP